MAKSVVTLSSEMLDVSRGREDGWQLNWMLQKYQVSKNRTMHRTIVLYL